MKKNIYVILAVLAVAVVCSAKDPAKPVPSNNFSAAFFANSTVGGFNQFVRLYYDDDFERVRLDSYMSNGVVESQAYYFYSQNITYLLYVPENSCETAVLSDPWIKAWDFLEDATYVGPMKWAGKTCDAWKTIDGTLGSNVLSCWNGNVPVFVEIESLFILDIRGYRPSVKDSDFDLPNSCNAV